jgi:uncharacterized damage-inducible protein DinB
MTTTNTIQNLAEYNIWANDRVLESFSWIKSEVPSQCLSLFSHALNAQAIWIARITGTQSPVKVWQLHTLEECRRLHEQTSPILAEMVRNLTEEEMNREIQYTNTQGNAYSTKVLDILTHAFNHATYHRAQVAITLRQSGHEPINSDYVTYVRELMGQA